jgi:hypothetical protein
LRRKDEARAGTAPWTNYIPYDLIGTIGRFRTTNVLAPLLVAEIIIGLFASCVTAWVGADHLLSWVLWIAFLVILAVILVVYIVLLVVDPNRLQSEEYLLEQQRILIGDERNPGKTIEQAPLTSNTVVGVIK